MSPLQALLISSRPVLERVISEHHPEEICALVFETLGEVELELVPNIADELHRADPETFPRHARTGYAIDGRLILAAERAGRRLQAIVHSHPAGGMGMSTEDLRLALTPAGDGPSWPGVAQVVLDAAGGLLRGFAVHRFDTERQGFVAAETWLVSRDENSAPRGRNDPYIVR